MKEKSNNYNNLLAMIVAYIGFNVQNPIDSFGNYKDKQITFGLFYD